MLLGLALAGLVSVDKREVRGLKACLMPCAMGQRREERSLLLYAAPGCEANENNILQRTRSEIEASSDQKLCDPTPRRAMTSLRYFVVQ